MNQTNFLAEMETKTHALRARRMVEIGQAVQSGDGQQNFFLEALEKGSFYERWLCLHSCYGSRDGERVLRFTLDASKHLRRKALRLAALTCNDAQTFALLKRLSFDSARRLLRWLHGAKRQSPIDLYLASLIEQNAVNEFALLPFGSSGLVQQNSVLISENLGQDGWKRMARLHPKLTADTLIAQAEKAARFDPRLVWKANLALPFLTNSQPDLALKVVKALQPLVSLSRLEVSSLALKRPNELSLLMLQTGEEVKVNFERRVERLEAAQLESLLERFPASLGLLPVWLKRLPPAQRGALYGAFGLRWRNGEGMVAPEVLALLPRSFREEEARRHLSLTSLSASPLRRLPYASFLSWEEARFVVQPFLQNPDAELRGAAHRALAVCLRYHRDHLAEWLDLFHARRNEQDPVRLVMLTGLKELPPGFFQEKHLDALGEIVFDALAAADLSFPSGTALQSRLITLVPFHAVWAAGKIAFVLQRLGRISVGNLEGRLSDLQAQRIAFDLLPVLKAWEEREREYDVMAFAQAFGKRLRVMPDLAAMLERILRRTQTTWVCVSILTLLAQHRREQAAVLIPNLLQSDGSWATQPVVYNWLHRIRQDLLTPYLGRIAYRGKFGTGSTRFVLPLEEGFFRWTKTQQETFALTLIEVTQDTQRDNDGLFRAIHQLAALPESSPSPLAALTAENSKNPAVRDTALRALGHMDAGQGIALLLEALNDDRARIAIYALRPALMEMPSKSARELLDRVPTNKVTVAKEAVRLLGDLRSEEAAQKLIALEAQELHRDVKIAVFRALWSYLEKDETWSVFQRAAASPDASVAVSVSRIPADSLSVKAQHRLVSLLETLLRHPDARVRLNTLLRCTELPVEDRLRVLLPRLLSALNDPTEEIVRAAAKAAFNTYFGEDAAGIGEALKQVLPNRRALSVVVETLVTAYSTTPRLLEPTLQVLLKVLSTDPLTLCLQTRLAVLVLPWQELTGWLTNQSEAESFHPDALQTAIQTMQFSPSYSSLREIERLETALAASARPSLRRLGLAALVRSVEHQGWTETYRELLKHYQQDSAALVAEAAQFTFPPVEAG